MSKKAKTVAKLLTVSMLASMMLTSCGGATQSPDQQGDTSEAATQQTGDTQTDETAGVSFPLAEQVELTAFMIGPFDNPEYNDNYVTDWIAEQTNVQLNFINQLSGDEGKTKLNLLMASGDKLPDVFLSTKWTKAEAMMYGQQGLVVPLNDYLENAENFNAYYTENPMRKGDITMSDGNIYTFGSVNECLHCMYQARMWIYKPWVDQLMDGKVPTTTEELYTYLKAIKENDPNGNGKADEIPYTAMVGGWANDPVVFLSNAFLQNNNMLSNTNPVVGAGFVVNNGAVEYQFEKEEYRQALEYLNKLYKEGLMDSQAFTQDGTQMSASCNAEEQIVGLATGGWFPCNTDELNEGKEGAWQDWVALDPVEGPDGVRLSAYYPSETFGSCVGLVSMDCENPEIAVQLFDFLMSEEATLVQQFGPEGTAWDYTEEGQSISGEQAAWKTYPYSGYKADNRSPDWPGVEQAQTFWDTDAAILGNNSDLRTAMFCEDPEMNSEGLLYKFGKAYSAYKPDDTTIFPNIAYSEEQARQLNDYTVSIGSYVNQATVQFITGDLNLEADWQAYLDKLNGMDLAGYLTLQQTAYDNYQEMMK